MKPALSSASAVGPERTSTTVGFPPPFALSLSKGQAELAEALVPRDKGFDRLSPNGDKAGLRYLSPNGSLRTVNFRNGPQADTDKCEPHLGLVPIGAAYRPVVATPKFALMCSSSCRSASGGFTMVSCSAPV